VSKIGNIKLIQHRPMEGVPKSATIRRTPTGKWFVTFSCEWEPVKLPEIDNSVGIDVGLKTFAVMSDNTQIENPSFFKQEQKALAKAQRKLEKCEKGTKKRKRVKKVVTRIHERITWRK